MTWLDRQGPCIWPESLLSGLYLIITLDEYFMPIPITDKPSLVICSHGILNKCQVAQQLQEKIKKCIWSSQFLFESQQSHRRLLRGLFRTALECPRARRQAGSKSKASQEIWTFCTWTMPRCSLRALRAVLWMASALLCMSKVPLLPVAVGPGLWLDGACAPQVQEQDGQRRWKWLNTSGEHLEPPPPSQLHCAAALAGLRFRNAK